MAEYEREINKNTPEYWDNAWSGKAGSGASSSHVSARVAELLDKIPRARVVEYGFGEGRLARLLGADRWEGREFSTVAVEAIKAEGFRAYVTRCSESPGYRKSYLVALSVLEHLDECEMTAFLNQSRNAPHAFFSVPPGTEARDMQIHMRGWNTHKEFAEFLRRWWKYVDVEVVKSDDGKTPRILAHCSTRPIERPPILTVGSSTLLDFWGTNYTLMNLQAQWGHMIEDGRVELVLVDNHPDPGDDPDSLEAVAIMEKMVKDCGGRYVQWCEKQGTYPGKNQLQVEARGDWVLTMDSHVFLSRHSLETVFDLIERNPESDDFYHFPVLHKPNGNGRRGVMVDHRHLDAIYHGLKHKPVYGYTGEMKKPGEPYRIAAQITSAYLVRRAAWFSAKGYDPILGMYGGWEGPIQTKWWLMGREVLSLRHREVEEMPLYHWHHFNTRVFKRAFKWAVDGFQHKGARVRYHTGPTKMRNYAASSAVTGGEAWVRRHCKLRGWDFNRPEIQEGMKAGLEFRPWMIENLARPEWEDITEFFRWMRDDAQIPGALREW